VARRSDERNLPTSNDHAMPRPNRTALPILKRELTPFFSSRAKADALALIFFYHIT
jgi:hypothetical protein